MDKKTTLEMIAAISNANGTSGFEDEVVAAIRPYAEGLGEVTEEKLRIIRDSDAILREEIAKAGLNKSIWQYFTVLPNIRSVGVMGDFRTTITPWEFAPSPPWTA